MASERDDILSLLLQAKHDYEALLQQNDELTTRCHDMEVQSVEAFHNGFEQTTDAFKRSQHAVAGLAEARQELLATSEALSKAEHEIKGLKAELEEDVVKLKRLSAAELSSLSKHHSCEVAALQHRLKTQHDEHEQQMISLTARHAKEVGAVREELAVERRLKEEAEQALDRDRRTLQLASITSGAGASDAVANFKTKNWELRKELAAVIRDRDNLRRLLNGVQQ